MIQLHMGSTPVVADVGHEHGHFWSLEMHWEYCLLSLRYNIHSVGRLLRCKAARSGSGIDRLGQIGVARLKMIMDHKIRVARLKDVYGYEKKGCPLKDKNGSYDEGWAGMGMPNKYAYKSEASIRAWLLYVAQQATVFGTLCTPPDLPLAPPCQRRAAWGTEGEEAEGAGIT